MDIDIGLWLTVAVGVTVAIWLLDFALRKKGVEVPKTVREGFEFSNSLVPVLAVVLVVRSFLFEPFTIPSGSMLPTLLVHDFVLVNKFSYGLRLPVTNTLILDLGKPERGDVMVFKYPQDPSKNYIKRVVGLPGDRIDLRGNHVYINGEQVPQRLLGSDQVVEQVRLRRGKSAVMPITFQRWTFVETLDGHPHYLQRMSIARGSDAEIRDMDGSWVVPDDHYFVMGDNRDNSEDSRVWGFVPDENIVGKASLIWMHWESLLSLPDFSRNGAIDKLEAEE